MTDGSRLTVPRLTARGMTPLDPTAAFQRLVEKRVTAGYLCRWAREAELSAQAAAQAEALFRADSLVTAHLRVYEVGAYRFLARDKPSADRDALMGRSWAVLMPVCTLLLRRLAANTLLPGSCCPEEVSFDADEQSAAYLLTGEKPPPREALLRGGSAVGYTTLLEATCHALGLLALPLWPDAERTEVEAFVLAALQCIPRTSELRGFLPSEAALATTIGELIDSRSVEDASIRHAGRVLSPNVPNSCPGARDSQRGQGGYTAAFCNAVLAKWESPGVASVLASRGVSCSTGYAQQTAAVAAEFAGRKMLDEQAFGLRSCPFPSCRRVEKTISEFRHCKGCRSAWYCSAAHQALEWTTHKLKCAELYAARREAVNRRSSRRLGTFSADAEGEAIDSVAAAFGLAVDLG